MWLWGGIAVWLICGLLAYGLLKDFLRRLIQKSLNKGVQDCHYDGNCESLVILLPLFGIFSLISVLIFLISVRSQSDECIPSRFPYLCFKMPKHLCKNRA